MPAMALVGFYNKLLIQPFKCVAHSRFHSRFQLPGHITRLSPNEVTEVLRANEYSQDFQTGPVKSYDTNQLASNNPMEDTRAEAKSTLVNGLLMGVFDGHAGAACAQVLAKRLFKYIIASLLPQKDLIEYTNGNTSSNPLSLLDSYNDRYEFVNELKDVYANSFKRYTDDLIKMPAKDSGVVESLEHAFQRLDDDFSKEALDDTDLKLLTVCMSGAVACVAYISDSNLHVANVGDCQAVLGVLNDNKVWTAKKLSTEHNSDNRSEVARLLKCHPENKEEEILKQDRLFGQLIPLRAFGDFRYKWSKENLEKKAVPTYGSSVIPPMYKSPPYLTAKPEVTYHRLTSKDKFLVLASDGLWDLLSPLQVVRMVGEHMSGKAALSPLRIPNNMKLKDIHKILNQRKEGLDKVPADRNAATHLIRNALQGTEFGVEQLLSLPQYIVREFRDDITVTVVYFDSDFITHCPM